MSANGAPDMRGQVCWVEVPATDVARAAAFYTAVLGWECDPSQSKPSVLAPAKSIHPFSKGALHGAFLAMPPDAPGAPADPAAGAGAVATYMVDSVSEALGRVEAAGGRVLVPKTKISDDMGFFARFVDTEGNVQGIWSKN